MKIIMCLSLLLVGCDNGAKLLDCVDGCTEVQVGSPGAQGDAGLSIVGPQGSQGETGAAGQSVVGPQGAAGSNGIDGAAGVNGQDGINGLNGAAGPQGIQGIAGSNGLDGLKGDTGDTGPMGPQGTPGSQGSAGTNATPVTIVNLCPGVTTYASVFVEVAICLDNKLYGVYSSLGGFMTYLPPGNYSSNAIGSACNLTVLPNCQVSY